MEKTVLLKVSLRKVLGCWCTLQSKTGHLGGFAFFSHLSPCLCNSSKGILKKGIQAAPVLVQGVEWG